MTLSMWEKYCSKCGHICGYDTHKCPKCSNIWFRLERPQQKFESMSEEEYMKDAEKRWKDKIKGGNDE